MFLGPAAVGKTSLRHGLMNQPLPDKPDSTILAQTRPVKYSWVKIAGTDSDHLCMAEVTEKDELDEEVLIVFAKEHSDMSRNHMDRLCHKAQSHEEVEKHTQQALAKAEVNEEPQPIVSSDMSRNRMDRRHHSLKAQSHEEVEKHTQQVLAKAAQMQSQHTKHQEMWLHLWDCGGQPVFLDVLPAFLSSRTVFLLMFDAARGLHSPFRVSIFNNGKQKDDAVLEITTLSLLQKWIASIHARFEGTEQQGMIPEYPRIILVGTHGDQLAPGQAVEEKKRLASEILHQLNASFEGKEYADMILGTGLVVDNTTAGKGALADSGFRELHNAIFTFVEGKLSTETPVSWVHFRKVLQLHTKKKEPVIKLAEVYSIASECHVPEGEVCSALLFYHELGVFLFYPNIEGLKSVVILEPQWLVDRFGELFASWKGKDEYRDMWKTLTDFGILIEPLYKAVWSNVREHNLSPDALVEMLEHFLLAASIVTSRLHAKSGKVKEYFVPHMLQHHLSQRYTPPPLTTSPGNNFFSCCIRPRTLTGATSTGQNSVIKKAAPIHLSFLSGYVPPGYYVRLATSLASKGVIVLFHTGIYRDQISMDIGVDRLTITEHNETIELQFSRQKSIEEPFRKSCRKLLLLLNECFSEVLQWLPGAKTELVFACLECSQSPQPDVSSRAKLCPFTIEQYTNQYLCCQFGHMTLPSPCQKYWLQYEMNASQQEQALFEEKIHLAKPVLPEVAVNLAKQLDIDPVSAIIHQYRCYGRDGDELVQILSDMKLTTWPDASQLVSDAGQLSTAVQPSPTASQTPFQDTSRLGRSSLQTGHRSISSEPQLKPLNRPPEYYFLLNKLAVDAKDKWKEIGQALDIPVGQLNSITMTDPILCYVDVFNWWQRNGSPPYTWATIIDALRAPIVGEVQLAHELEKWITTVQAAVAATSITSTAAASSIPGVHGSTRDTITASNIPELNSTTDRSCSGQDTSTTSGNGVVSTTTSGESLLRGAVQPAALTLQPTTSSDPQAHSFARQPAHLTMQPSHSNSQEHGKSLNVSNAYKAVIQCSDWHELGILLNVDYKTLEEISSSKREKPSACKSAMLDAWLKGNANASWKQLADALKVMGNLKTSQAVENEYC